MNPEIVIDLGREAIKACLMIGGPVLLLSLVIGILIGVGQSMFQVQDQSVSFVPKLIALIVVVGVALPWLADRMVDYSREMFSKPLAFNADSETIEAKVSSTAWRSSSGSITQDAPSSTTNPFSTPVTGSKPEGSSSESPDSMEPSKPPFQLPGYRYSRLPRENKGG